MELQRCDLMGPDELLVGEGGEESGGYPWPATSCYNVSMGGGGGVVGGRQRAAAAGWNPR